MPNIRFTKSFIESLKHSSHLPPIFWEFDVSFDYKNVIPSCLGGDFVKNAKRGEINMSLVNLNALRLRCPQPLFKIAAKSPYLKPGDILEVVADCPTFEQDIFRWCSRTKKTLLWIKQEDNGEKRCQIMF